MNVQEIKLKDIKPYGKNPRKNDDAVPYVAESIKQFGFKVPIVIDKNNVIVAGHTRYKAAKKLGFKSVPCIIADDLTDEQIKAFRLADNKVSEKAEWDLDLLDSEIEGIFDIVLDLFGGSGSTLIACEQMDRRCRMMEYDPAYCDVIVNRWEKFTGNKAELIREVERNE